MKLILLHIVFRGYHMGISFGASRMDIVAHTPHLTIR